MPERCPPGTALAALSSGSLPNDEEQELQAHVSNCLRCATQLESITCAQLAALGAMNLGPATLETSPVVQKLIDLAQSGLVAAHEITEAAAQAALEAPANAGTIGRFAGYDLLEVAGSGGMGVVFKAHDPTLHRTVALKVLPPTRPWDEESAERFLREARTIAAIQHDNVVAIYTAGREKGLPYLVMPFHAAGTLEQWLQQTQQAEAADVVRVGIQLARALEVTHAKGVLHRDIKPSNVLLEPGLERVRLADFGLAQLHGVPALAGQLPGLSAKPETAHIPPAKAGTSSFRMIAGTPHYMSPEQARGATIDARSDLFGLGAVLYHLATGQTVYEGQSPREVLQAAAQGKPRPVREVNPEVAPGLATIIDRMLSTRPEQRFAAAAEVATALEQLARTENRYWRWTKRASIGALAACLALGAMVFALDWTGQTAVLNTLLCQRRGDDFHLRGRFGTYPRLSDALAAARPHDVIEVRFSGERLIDPFRVGGKPLTIRAAKGFTPVFVATNNGQPLILADAPLTLEGLTLWRRGPVVNFVQLISVESAPLHLLNCRLLRSRFQGQNVLVWGRLRVTGARGPPFYPVLLTLHHGSVGYLRNCLVAGTQATAIGLRASTNQPTRVDAENSLFLIDRAMFMRPEGETNVDLKFARSVLVTGGLLELDETGPGAEIAATWEDCIVERTGGALVRVNQAQGGALLRALKWKETNVIYAGQGAFVVNRRRRQLNSEAEWNEFMRLATNNHRLIDRPVFPETCVRSSLTLNASDLDAETLREANLGATRFNPAVIGEGEAYEKFRRSADYREWRKEVRAFVLEWETGRKRHASP